MWLWLVGRKQTLVAVSRAGVLVSLSAVGWVPVLGLLASNLPPSGRLLVAGLAGVSLARPRPALLVLAGLAPLGGLLGALAGMPFGLAEPLALAFLAGWLSRESLRPTATLSAATQGLLVPVVLLAAVVVTSSAVGLAALQPFIAYPREFLRELLSFCWSSYFIDVRSFESLTSGVRFLEGLGLFAAAIVLAEGAAGAPPALVRMIAAGAIGVAALSLNRLGEVVLRNGGTWEALSHYVVTMRITTLFPDVNAAGSYFAMTALMAIGLALAPGRARWAWAGGACMVMAALLLTGSRAALVAVAIAGVTLLVMGGLSRDGLRGRRAAAVAVVALALAGIVGAIPFALKAPDRATVGLAMQYRRDFARAALAMTAAHPAFGVGIGSFKSRSGAYFTPQLRAHFPSENAHNNFLQVLGEVGVVGFVPFLWLLGGVGRQAWLAVVGRRADWRLLGTAGGVGAFVTTWMAGHPLLMVEVSLAFWMVLGACAGLARAARGASPPGHGTRGRRRSILSAAVIAFLVLTVSGRVKDAVASADLSGAAIGCSEWRTDEAGAPSRWIIAPRAQFFVPSDASGVRLPFRLAAADRLATADIAIYLDGRLANRIRLAAGDWLTVAMVLPERAGDRHFHRIEVEVGAGHASAPPAPGDADRLVEGIQMGEPVLIPTAAR